MLGSRSSQSKASKVTVSSDLPEANAGGNKRGHEVNTEPNTLVKNNLNSSDLDQNELDQVDLTQADLIQADLIQGDLSKRELEIVELVSAGLTNQEISEQLAISKRTVDNHVSNVLTKTGTGNRVALVRWALQTGKVCIDELNCCRLPGK